MKNLKRKFVCFALSLSMLLLMLSTTAMASDYQTDGATEINIAYDAVTVFPDGGKDYIFYIEGTENHYLVPPIGFTPLTASDEDLSRYGFPPRPDGSDVDSLNAWEELMANYVETPEPELVATVAPVESMEQEISALRTTEVQMTNWSGYVADLGASSTNFYTQVQMDYTHPAIISTSGRCVNSYWVGLGGINKPRLVQAGTATWVDNATTTHGAWYEYIGRDGGSSIGMKLLSLPIRPGDNIHVYISFQAANNIFSYYIANNTTGQSAASTVNLSAATQFDGLSAEWIVERCSENRVNQNLGNYGSLILKSCRVTMMSNTGTRALSVPGSIVSNNQFTCTWRNYN